jgi:hypothetical protein
MVDVAALANAGERMRKAASIAAARVWMVFMLCHRSYAVIAVDVVVETTTPPDDTT